MRSIRYVLLGCLLVSLGCRDYTGDQYILEENLALQQLIPQMIKLDAIFRMNEIPDNSINIYIVSKLNTDIKLGDSLEPKLIGEQDGYELFEMVEPELYTKEKKLFKPFLEGAIESRILSAQFTNPRIKIIVKEENGSSMFMEQCQEDSTLFGCLWVSRIAFDPSFETGYLAYSFYCGQGCAWNNNIEIMKEDGMWVISRYFSGGVA